MNKGSTTGEERWKYINGCGGDDRDYDDAYMMVHGDDGDGDRSAKDDDDVPFFKVEPALHRCVLWLNMSAYSLCVPTRLRSNTPYLQAI